MSAIVKDINLRPLATKSLLPDEELIQCFNETLKELNIEFNHDRVNLKNGTAIVKIGPRILFTFHGRPNAKIDEEIESIRQRYTFNAEIYQKKYVEQLQQEIERKKLEEKDLVKLDKLIKMNQEKIEASNRALEIQKMDICNALIEELKIAALEKGYDIEETINKDETQLQFIRRSY